MAVGITSKNRQSSTWWDSSEWNPADPFARAIHKNWKWRAFLTRSGTWKSPNWGRRTCTLKNPNRKRQVEFRSVFTKCTSSYNNTTIVKTSCHGMCNLLLSIILVFFPIIGAVPSTFTGPVSRTSWPSWTLNMVSPYRNSPKNSDPPVISTSPLQKLVFLCKKRIILARIFKSAPQLFCQCITC